MDSWIHPGLIFIFGALLIPLLPGRLRQIYLLVLPALAFWDVLTMTTGVYGSFNYLGFDIVLGRVDKLSLVFAHVFTLMAILGVPLRPAREGRRPADGRLLLCRRLPGRHFCRGLPDGLHLLGNDGLRFGLPDLAAAGTGLDQAPATATSSGTSSAGCCSWPGWCSITSRPAVWPSS